MHGQAKIKTTADEQERRQKQKLEKVKQYRIRMDRFFAKRKDSIRDDETINIINDILSTQPDIYTLWNYKKEVLLFFISSRSEVELAKILDSELRVTEGCLRVNPKSYCAWYHREWLLTHFPNPDLERELKLCTAYLKLDDRNFHCWDYRRWIVAKSGVSDKDELDYTTSKIEDNFSNYSAWHSRSKLLPRVHPNDADPSVIDPEVQLSELDLVVNAAFTDPADQSAWFYQRWLVRCCSSRPGAVPVAALRQSNMVFIALAAAAPAAHITVTYAGETFKTSKVNSNLVILKTAEEVDHVTVTVRDVGEWNLKFNEKGVWYIPELPEKTKPTQALLKVLIDQLRSCNELLALEPTSKWTLLTSVHLMLAIDKLRFMNEVVERLNVLMEVDPYRTNYYADLMSSELMENAVRQCWQGYEINLRGLDLQCLPWSHCLLIVTSVDMSNNSLSDSALPALIPLISCKKLKLNENCIQSLENFPSLKSLESLEIDNNSIIATKTDIINFLYKLPNLTSLTAKNNPASEIIERISKEKSLT